ncbi:MAG TPA: hypothetical protein VF503_16500 [Sphingobium sp.]
MTALLSDFVVKTAQIAFALAAIDKTKFPEVGEPACQDIRCNRQRRKQILKAHQASVNLIDNVKRPIVAGDRRCSRSRDRVPGPLQLPISFRFFDDQASRMRIFTEIDVADPRS